MPDAGAAGTRGNGAGGAGAIFDDGNDEGGSGAKLGVLAGGDTSRATRGLSRVLDVLGLSRRTRLGCELVRLFVTRPLSCGVLVEALGDGEVCGLLEIDHELLNSPFGFGVAVAAGVALFGLAVVAFVVAVTALLVTAASVTTLLFASTATLLTSAAFGVTFSTTVCETGAETSASRFAAPCAHNIHNKLMPATDINGRLRVQNVG